MINKNSVRIYTVGNAIVPLPFYIVCSFDQITWPFFGQRYSINESQMVTPKKKNKNKLKRLLNHNKYKQNYANNVGRLDGFSFRFSTRFVVQFWDVDLYENWIITITSDKMKKKKNVFLEVNLITLNHHESSITTGSPHMNLHAIAELSGHSIIMSIWKQG